MDTREHDYELIDLGAASDETRGQAGNLMDFGVEGRPIGMSDDD